VCRNIRVLHHFDPPSTPEEIRAAAVQYVRKVSGVRVPTARDQETFERAVAEIAVATERLISQLPAPRSSPPRTRESEREKARLKWGSRVARMKKDS
jgi:hypothetical protein